MKAKFVLYLATGFLFCAVGAQAIPFLQLDIGGGVYIGGTEETVFSVDNPFTLYALVDTTSSSFDASETYYLSAAIVPSTMDPPLIDFGSFTVDGTAYDVNNDMVYGNPPVVDGANPELGSHGIFETHFAEISFTSLPGLATAYNSQDNPGGPTDNALGSLAYASFVVDISGLTDGFSVHFDLYTLQSNGAIDNKAPFSHDAQSNGVPDNGATFALLSISLLGVERLRRRNRN